jgi:hypothetical protein
MNFGPNLPYDDQVYDDHSLDRQPEPDRPLRRIVLYVVVYIVLLSFLTHYWGYSGGTAQ